MKTIVKSATIALVVSFFLTACSGLTVSNPDSTTSASKRNDKLGTSPGLLVKDQDKYDDGFVVFSSDPDKKSALNPNAGNQPMQQQQGNFQTPPNGSDFSVGPGEEADFEEFKEFQQFRRFQNAPDSADERQQFKQWQEWENYKRWKQSNGTN